MYIINLQTTKFLINFYLPQQTVSPAWARQGAVKNLKKK